MGKAEHHDLAAVDYNASKQRALVERLDPLIADGEARRVRMVDCVAHLDSVGEDSTKARFAVDSMNRVLLSWHSMRARIAATLPTTDARDDQRQA